MKTIKYLLAVVLVTNYLFAKGQDFVLPLYNGTIPNNLAMEVDEKVTVSDITLISNVSEPLISVYLPSKRFATGQAVIICPGGGYWVLAHDLEGTDIAKYLNSIGVAGIVLKYRLPTTKNTKDSHDVPLMDAQRAVRLVRANAANWNIDSTKIGIMGFSAGGHLASTVGTHFDYGNKTSSDLIERESCRPDFMVLVYPVISFVEEFNHAGSKEGLLGKNPSKKLIDFFSNELHVQKDSPPTFLIHADNDKGVSPLNSIGFYKALKQKNVPVELHILSEGDHGFGLGLSDPHVSQWTNSLRFWLESINRK